MEKEFMEARKEADEEMGALKQRIRALERSRKELVHGQTVVRKRMARLAAAKRNYQRKLTELVKSKPSVFNMVKRGVYTKQARSLARYLASTGTAEAKVGKTIKRIAEAMGLQVDRVMSKHTVQRSILEAGVAADIQMAFEMAKACKLCYSSDSTSHKHIEYESRFIALQVVDYERPDQEPQWVLRSLGIGTSVDHRSETQVQGLKERLADLADIFNRSPLAKREGIRFSADNFAYKLIGTSGDHANDQKKSHKVLHEWRMDVLCYRMGKEALMKMDPVLSAAILLPLKWRQLQTIGQSVWEAMTEEEKGEKDDEVIREFGKAIFENLPTNDQAKLSRFIRTGCCMHKDLNCFKWGDKSMQEMWKAKGLVPPCLLANKENVSILEGCVGEEPVTADQKRAMDASKRGGSKTVELGGMICKNKDSKKGQQDTYRFWMVEHLGFELPYPDVSNTRYGSHGAAAATVLTQLPAFRQFINHVHDTKDRPGYTNIEQNFARALDDIPTITEIAVLALYHVAVSQPFMRYVRQEKNLLKLEPFFNRMDTFLASVATSPTVWSTPGHPYGSVFLDSNTPDTFSAEVLNVVHQLAPTLPHLDDSISAFTTGAREAFVERFSDEFREGNGIDSLTEAERDDLFFASTNDANEGALGSWRLAQRRRVSETLHKFNASFTAELNGTEFFIEHMLTEEADEIYLRKEARLRDEDGLQRQLKEAQVEADRKKAEENRLKVARREEKEKEKANAILATGQNLILDDSAIEKLTNDGLNLQLDYHRDLEKSITSIPDTDRIPLKSHMKLKSDRIRNLKLAVSRYRSRQTISQPPVEPPTIPSASETGPVTSEHDSSYEYDYYDDFYT
ncbi:hypothetical protein CC1G_07530 [Coprinopsis cinerea okayama7|uniref:Uncharacterized protein n=1 Tax=Coprinopsis cinerea (strain Okayama-7 / 130 / ATCC MYA-4618 / FGSC 9003) TaxID=240176 RepID=A8P176_COPC7|nr:hypothetical protein CC1G_07530 [Coprinopsis cinerea okayama7\|eukprot:XP_001838040.2 hypothetical protein CC1G_07530 [Coprinopsis cinerea okayama7\